MISQITIKHFQSHRETVLDLHEGVNALIGLTGAGKSVVFKALDWVFSNRPLGTEFRSWEGGDTQVEIVLKEGQKVGRIRTDSENYYYIDKKKFEAFGKGPPPRPVLELLNLSDVNFQAQADPSFLISNSSGEVARYLNRAAHLDIIDQTLSNIASTLRGEKEDFNRVKEELERAREELKKYDWLPGAEDELVELEGLQEKVSRLKTQRIELSEIVSDYGKTEAELYKQNVILFWSEKVDLLIYLHEKVEEQNTKWEQLAAVIDRYEKINKELEAFSEVEKLRKKTEKFLVLAGVINQEKEERNLLSHVAEDYERATVALGQAGKEAEKFQKEFDRLMPDVCPLCDGTGGKRK